ncbi:MAG: TonB-dependent receptor [Acidobacterium ailaaui]|nr:TonB-dependent receptor [Pseudacidobacterium ailaaui]
MYSKLSTIRFFIPYICFLLLFYLSASAQTVRLSGEVRNASTGDPLPGVTVRLIGANAQTETGTITDANGRFSLTAPQSTVDTLLVTYVGYQSQKIAVGHNTYFQVRLYPASQVLNEAVVIGYGTQSKKLLTGAVSSFQNHNLQEIPTSRLDNALEGRIAGLTIQTVDNEPGAEPVVRVRGANSISANQSPLVVVDGTPVPDGLAFINPYDVASIDVLKDAASSAIYGSRGANGVILITTKEGSTGKPKFSIDSYYGFKQAYELNPIMTFSQYVEKLYREANLRANDPTVPANKVNLASSADKAGYILENQIVGFPTDWQRIGLDNHANIYNLELGISGGNNGIKYYLSGNLQKDEGLMIFSEMDRASVRGRITGNLSKKLKFDVNFNPSFSKRIIPAENYTDFYRFYSFVPVYHTAFTAAFVHQNPQWADINPGDYAQARHFNGLSYMGILPDGSYWQSSGPVTVWSTKNNTPFSVDNSIQEYTNYYRMLGGGSLTYTLLPGLELKTSPSFYYLNSINNTFAKTNAQQDGQVNNANITNIRYVDLLWENTLNYTHQFGNHNLNILLGYSAEKTYLDTSNMYGYNFPTDNFDNFTLNLAGAIDQSQTYTLSNQIGLLSYIGRVMYNYKAKYLFSASIRRDGSSYFAPGHKWGWFPSVSAGWIISDEPFMKPISWLSNLKIRMSYGATGNNKIVSFAYDNLLYPSNYDFGSGTGTVVPGLAPNGAILGNPNITWEKTLEYDAGLDVGLLDNNILFSIDYYNSKTSRLLLQQATMSFTGSYEYWNNAGSVQNQGIEISITSNNIHNNKFSWNTSFNLTANRNKLLSLGGIPYLYSYGERNEVYAAIVGKPSIEFFGYKTDGVWTSQAQIDSAVAKGLTSNLSNYFQPGGLKIVDVNHDNKIDPSDRVPLGSPFPDFTWGMTNQFSYSGFDLSILIQGSQGGKMIWGDAYYNEVKKFNKRVNTDQRWISAAYPGDGKTPYFTNGINWMLTDYVIQSASYVSVRNVILGYTLPEKLTQRLRLSSFRIYFSVDNLLYFMPSSYKGINPEARLTSGPYSSPLISGYQRGEFPISRNYTFGIHLNF